MSEWVDECMGRWVDEEEGRRSGWKFYKGKEWDFTR